MILTVSVTQGYDDTLDGQWNGLSGNVYMNAGWVRYQHSDSSCVPYTITVMDGVRLVGALPAWVVHGEKNVHYLPQCDASAPYLLCGNRRGYSNALMVRNGYERRTVTSHLMQGVRTLLQTHALTAAWFPFLTAADVECLQSQTGLSVSDPVLLDAGAFITVPGESFADYLQSVPARVRKRVRNDRNRFARAGYAVRVEPLSQCYERMAVFSTMLEHKYGDEISVQDNIEYMRRQARCLGDCGQVLLCSHDGRDVGACLLVEGAQEIASRACGFDYGGLRDAREYFELGYYLPIERCCDIGARRLSLGVGSYEAKRRRGAAFTLLWAVAVSVDDTVVCKRAGNAERMGYLRSRGVNAEVLGPRDCGSMHEWL